ncbi:ATP-grasp domain-containing protein [Micromonospora sp. NPDC049230]|uniref:ATP-grasp domain-containing protein n=1 Tax=Micromonospora sp. NPDC049230 TaxID=3155502 RepID=UPI0033E66129
MRTDGVWRVVELGDGQVSDRPTTVEPQTMIDVLLAQTRREKGRSVRADPV